jgi:hypothetical protein
VPLFVQVHTWRIHPRNSHGDCCAHSAHLCPLPNDPTSGTRGSSTTSTRCRLLTVPRSGSVSTLSMYRPARPPRGHGPHRPSPQSPPPRSSFCTPVACARTRRLSSSETSGPSSCDPDPWQEHGTTSASHSACLSDTRGHKPFARSHKTSAPATSALSDSMHQRRPVPSARNFTRVWSDTATSTRSSVCASSSGPSRSLLVSTTPKTPRSVAPATQRPATQLLPLHSGPLSTACVRACVRV